MIRILRSHDMVRECLTEMNYLLDWFKRDNVGEFSPRVQFLKSARRIRMHRLEEILTQLGLDSRFAGQLARGKWNFERVVRRSRSKYLKAIGEISTPRRRASPTAHPFQLS